MMTKNAPKKCSHRATYSIPKFRKTSRPLTHKYTFLAKLVVVIHIYVIVVVVLKHCTYLIYNVK